MIRKGNKAIRSGTLAVLGLGLAVVFLAGCGEMTVLHPQGEIGTQEASLIRVALLLMLVVVIPVLVLAVWFPVRYRSKHNMEGYAPGWKGSKKIEWVIWTVPVAIVLVLSWLTWVKTRQLDPYRPLQGKNEPLQVEVISLDWKWLFIYPDLDIATVNQLVFPENTPLAFRLTSASVMTSFFIPQLGSQMYAMGGMQTRLNLVAADTGTYVGQNREFSGWGYETMFFKARSVSEEDFVQWSEGIRQSGYPLDPEAFEKLAQPSVAQGVTVFSRVEPGLFDRVIKSIK